MGRYNSAEEVREDRLRVLGTDLGAIYDALYNEVLWLHTKWGQYCILYAHSEARVELLNSVSGFFFSMIQDLMWQDIMLHLARLTDPKQSMSKDNLSLDRLKDEFEEGEFASRIGELVEDAKSKVDSVRRWRNRYLAHSDLQLACGVSAQPLPGVSRRSIEEALAAVRGILNAIELHYWNAQAKFEIVPIGDTSDLVRYIEKRL